MTRVTRLFLLLTALGPLHMIEQMATNLEEFHMIQRDMAGYWAWFGPARADLASVVLITLIWTLASLLLYAMLRGGTARLAVLGVFGVFAVTELHHVVESFAKGGYDAGLITCVPYAIAGWYLTAAVWREYRAGRTVAAGFSVPARATR